MDTLNLCRHFIKQYTSNVLLFSLSVAGAVHSLQKDLGKDINRDRDNDNKDVMGFFTTTCNCLLLGNQSLIFLCECF